MTLGEKIFSIRKNANLSQEQFGELLGVSRQSVSKWESNQVQPELKTIIEISNTFHISLDELLKDTKNSSNNNSFEAMANKNMKFKFGCLITIIGIIYFLVMIYTNRDLIAYLGGIAAWIAFTGLTLELVLDICVIVVGIYICYLSTKK